MIDAALSPTEAENIARMVQILVAGSDAEAVHTGGNVWCVRVRLMDEELHQDSYLGVADEVWAADVEDCLPSGSVMHADQLETTLDYAVRDPAKVAQAIHEALRQ